MKKFFIENMKGVGFQSCQYDFMREIGYVHKWNKQKYSFIYTKAQFYYFVKQIKKEKPSYFFIFLADLV